MFVDAKPGYHALFMKAMSAGQEFNLLAYVDSVLPYLNFSKQTEQWSR